MNYPPADPETWMWYEAQTEDRMRTALGNRLYNWLDREAERLEREKGIMKKHPWVCECGWNGANLTRGMEAGTHKVIESQKTQTEWGPGCEMLVEVTCPDCGRVFQYGDGYP